MSTEKANLFELVQGCLDNSLSPNEFARLQAILASDPHAVEIFVHAARLDYMLEELCARDNPSRDTANLLLASLGIGGDVISGADGGQTTSKLNRAAHRLDYFDTSKSKSLLQLGRRNVTARLMAASRRSRFVVATAIACCLLVTIAAWKYQWLESAGNSPQQAAIGTTKSEAGDYPLLSIGEIRIDEGTARLRLPDVGHVLVEGPAELELLTPKRLRLTKGRINVSVTEPTGYGFVVVTQHGEITDLGTVFGVDATDEKRSGVVVFDGSVDLRMPGAAGAAVEAPPTERLNGGDGVLFRSDGHLDRIVSIYTGNVATFEQVSQRHESSKNPIISKVTDNLRTQDTKRYYQIVNGGLEDDVKAYVDRPHQWNGVSTTGLPDFLRGADYVMTFNDDKRDYHLDVTVTFDRDANVYVFFDKRSPIPSWLVTNFEDTGIEIGLDEGYSPRSKTAAVAEGAGNSIDTRFGIWKSIASRGETLVLGPPKGQQISATEGNAMYGIAATGREE